MTVLRFPNDIVQIAGALDLAAGEDGVWPRRLPVWTRQLLPSPFLEFDVAATAGVRLRFRTDASTIALILRCNALELGDLRFDAVVDLLVDGKLAQHRTLDEVGRIHFEGDEDPVVAPGARMTVVFDQLGASSSDVEIWLPHTAACELISLDVDGAISPSRLQNQPNWIHYGSSISHCLETAHPADTWPARVAIARSLDLVNLGFAGQAVLDPFVARAIRDTPADLISLKIGINVVGGALMRERTFRSAVDGFIDTIREGHPSTRLLIVSAIHSPRYEQAAAEGELSLARSREVLAEVVGRRQQDDPQIEYLDGRLLLGPDESDDLPDGLHPRSEAYLRMAERFIAHTGL